MNKWISILALCLAGAMGAQATFIDWDGGGGLDTEWNTVVNWETNSLTGTLILPGNNPSNQIDRADFFQGTDVATVTTSVTSTNQVDIMMRNNGKITISADMDSLRNIDIGVNGGTTGFGTFIKQNAGTVNASRLTLGTAANDGLYEISGTGTLELLNNLTVGAVGKVSVIGSGASLAAGNGEGDNFTVQTTGILQFQLDADGVGTIDAAGTFTVDSTNSVLTIDAASYQGAAADIDLVTFSTNIGTFATSNITVTGVQSYSIGYDADSMFVSVVPYPTGTTLLLGEDDFDGTTLYASRTFSGTVNNGGVNGSTFGVLGRETVNSDAVQDTSVYYPDGSSTTNAADTVGYLESSMTNNNHLVITRAGDRSLTYTFNIEGYNNLQLDADWIIGDGWYSDVTVDAVIDGGPTSTVFFVDTKGETWTLDMESGAAITNTRAAQVYANGVSQGTFYDSWASFSSAITNGTGSTLTLIVSQPGSFRGSLGMDNLKLYGDVAPKPGDTVAIGSDDFDTTGTYASRTIVGGANSAGGITWNVVSRDNIQYPGMIDTSVAAGGVVATNAADNLGFLGTNKTDNIFGMYRAGAGGGGRTLTYTFDITDYADLNLLVDWAASGNAADKNVSISSVIDGGATNVILDIGSSGTDWTEVMDNGTNILRGNSFTMTVNGVATNNLSDEFQTYNPVIDGTGSELTLIVTMLSGIGGYGGFGMDNLVLNGTLTEPPAPGVDYDSWAASYGLEGAEADENYDVEPDGLDNLMEYALGGDPTVDDAATVAPATYTADDGGTDYFYHVYDQRVDDDALTFVLGATDDLVGTAPDTNDVSFVGQSDEVDGFRTQTNRTEATSAAKFIQLKIEK